MVSETVESLCQRAKQATTKGQIEEARKLYQQALGLKANSPDVQFGLATTSFMLKDLESAAYHFTEVTRLDPLRPGAYINLGAVLNRLGEYDEAVKVLQRGIQLDARRAEGHYNLGLVYKNMKKPEQAIAAYSEAVRLNPNMIDAHYNLANVYLETHQFDLAVARYKQVLQLRPNWDKALKGLGAAETGRAQPDVPPPAEPTPVAKAARSDADLDRMVDPAVHGEILKELYKATTESENQGRIFLQTLESEIEPAIKDLSTCLLRPETAGFDLGDCVDRFELAIDNIRAVHQELKASIENVRTVGEQLIES